ncbi:asparagine--tRNA ligase, putative [Plasmodium knowlesi strain H]|uniref:asparagine--tRNA ligase n=3 Tax=Plasmodium knowlesi TaxID=5850 RepID=A0A5K1UZH3_PLAKH|nr:asparagine--tRNA ligase, putative [Plasmodium knowlesi strain H]OTN67225.1 putative Asparagine--t RNA ligase [Plasmodium knowlesi]CAA9988744.1 asparagine--tRNA ligase, putative [Plasmodium knowlesi strain H]SBO21694.1 asparagine--tRNA ligase, putative [Plasmodium knowlesi strain H]SBO22068.1 asparagine--tRNA ligase, putative [Plasmodium knowlesi strain H]VVS78218.1 asparagine--tRNA ligase, putative [Plasmodium knowlesi strain H]|eukprot:XP_002259720.1 asparagine--t RNA ligase, putative [Plasmodium knowlesi strain H]
MGIAFSHLVLSITLLGLLARGIQRSKGRVGANALTLQLCGQRGPLRQRREGGIKATTRRTTTNTTTVAGGRRKGETALMRGAFLFKDNTKYSWYFSRGAHGALDWSRSPGRKRFFAKLSGENGSQWISNVGEQTGKHVGNESGEKSGERSGEKSSEAFPSFPSGAQHLEPSGRTKIKDILGAQVTHREGQKYTVCGWVKSIRTVGKNRFSFIDINDGSHVKNLQVVIDSGIPNYGQISRLLRDDAVECVGELKGSLGRKQQVELCVQAAEKAHYVKLLGKLDGGVDVGEETNDRGLGEKGSGDVDVGEETNDRGLGEKGTGDVGVGEKGSGDGGLRSSPSKHYAISKKYHTKEHLRCFPHLRARTKLYSSVFRLKSDIVTETFNFWREKNCTYINTPVLTSNDCEGAGKLFHATTLMSQVNHRGEHTNVNFHDGYDTDEGCKREVQKEEGYPHEGNNPFARDFFKKPCYLNVSSQLALECLCCSMGDVFTLNQCFRAENSNTVRHLSEFLMMEVELAFCNLSSIISIAEEYIKAMIKFALYKSEDIDYINEHHDQGLKHKLQNVLQKPFVVITYNEAIHVIKKNMVRTDELPVRTTDLTLEEQKFLTDMHFRSPVVVINYPQNMKPFYMNLNEDGKTVACMDILLPEVGEVVGGSEREIRIHTLERRMKEKRLDLQLYEPYLELRRYGNIPHAGFGLGMDRLIMFITSMVNIRDVVPFPRAPGSLFM